MSLTLQLPSGLSTELEHQAERIGLPPEEHATELLAVAAAILGDDFMPAFGSAEERLQAAVALQQVVRAWLDESSEPRDERVRRFAERLARWVVQEQRRSMGHDPAAGARPSAFGKYRERIGSSEDYAQFKQGEIDREDRRSA